MRKSNEVNARHVSKSPLLMSLRQAAREYGFDRGTLSGAIQRGELRAYRPTPRRYRLLRSDIEAWLRRYTVKPGPGSSDRVQDPVVRKRLEREARGEQS